MFLEKAWGLYNLKRGPWLCIWFHHVNPWIWVVGIFWFHSSGLWPRKMRVAFSPGFLQVGMNPYVFFLSNDLISQQFWARPAITAELSDTRASQLDVKMPIRILFWLGVMGVPGPGRQLVQHISACRMWLRVWKHWPILSPFGPAKRRGIKKILTYLTGALWGLINAYG